LKNDYDMIQKAKILLGTGLDINRLTDCSSMTSKTSALYQLRCASNSNSYSNFPLMKALEEFLLSQGAQSIKEEKCFGK
ncbi:hypothetical protein EBU24_06560, partial [bacterium]|nr:hypothetical protein [bacterium]